LRNEPRFKQLVERVFSESESTSSVPVALENTIAILPFQDVSNDQKKALLPAGIQDEILTSFSRVASSAPARF
jgi:TolB-like protein